MSFVASEIQRLHDALCAQPTGPLYPRFHAAQQALAWALEPSLVQAPFDMIIADSAPYVTDCLADSRQAT
jgi:hypothetical protein